MSDSEVLDLLGAILPQIKINNLPGKLITIDSLDGSGGSTQIDLLSKYLQSLGIQATQTKEPTSGDTTGDIIRGVLQDKPAFADLIEAFKRYPFDFQKLFTINRAGDLDNLILPTLEFGMWLIADRYSPATLAFGSSQKVALWRLATIILDYPWPNLVLILKVPVEECLVRIEERLKGTDGKKELFEKKETLERTWEAYEIIADRFPNTFIVDGTGTQKEVSARIREVVHSVLLNN